MPDTDLFRIVSDKTLPLESEADLEPLLDRIGEARFVLLGEASHGTHEYYEWRAAISRRLIEEKGFSFIAVEGDWPDCYAINQFVKSAPGMGDDPVAVLKGFSRWPTWMWANEEVASLMTWLRAHNSGLSEDRQVGFYGLDVYSLWESMHAIIEYLQRTDPGVLEQAYRAFSCFEPYGGDAERYAYLTSFVSKSCENEVVDLLLSLGKRERRRGESRDDRFDAEQNALVAVNAERYYRAMISGDEDSWNVRDRHMAETLDRLARLHGLGSKSIVWAHNTHVGDARATDMSSHGLVNIGQLVREKYGLGDTVLVGFGSHQGEVVAGSSWGASIQRMPVLASRLGSWENILHRSDKGKCLLLLGDRERQTPSLAARRGHRAIGVVYDPAHEAGNYVPTSLPNRYDVFLFFDRTTALRPITPFEVERDKVAETFPMGV